MTVPVQLSGHDRTYRPPRAVRTRAAGVTEPDSLTARLASGNVTAWDLFELEQSVDPAVASWAGATLESVVAAADADMDSALGCGDCQDTGFYGVPASGDPDTLIGLIKREGDDTYATLLADGIWEPCETHPELLEILDLETAGDLAAAITAGAGALVRRWAWPIAFLPPEQVVSATTVQELVSAAGTGSPQHGWVTYGVVDDVDPGALLDIVRIKGVDEVQRLVAGAWEPDDDLLVDGTVPLVPLAASVLAPLVARAFPAGQKCEYCKEPATQRILHSEGMAYTVCCDEHLDKAKDAAIHCTPDGTADESNINWIHPADQDAVAAGAGALLADAPLTVSPNPKAERLRRYWSHGKGGAKIRWGMHGDWRRCYRHLRKYMGLRAKGYCQNMHKRNTGVWTGDRRNRGLLSAVSPEESLLTAIRTGHWSGPHEKGTDMTDALLKDGIYCETDNSVDGLLNTLVAGGFPVAPPDSWFANPGFTAASPMRITDEGQVSGHIATWDQVHIGMHGDVRAPKSRSGYAYFLTGSLKTESGKEINVGQLTLAGGHASMHAGAEAAVKHYDDTKSGVADVTVGEDAYGIWAAGALRPDVTPEQLRVFRASAISGDWRPIGGGLELVAACSVNVPGFPIARARVAGGAIVALVAAGAAPLARLQAASLADEALRNELDEIKTRVAALEAIPETPVETPAPAEQPVETPPEEPAPAPAEEPVDTLAPESTDAEVPEVDGEKLPETDDAAVAEIRAEMDRIRAQRLREEISGIRAAGAGERKGIGGYPIKNEQDLKNAIQAFGRAKPEDRARTKAHIISAANKLGLSKLIPDNWK